MKDTAIALARQAGDLLMTYLGAPGEIGPKGDLSNIVTAADLASEASIVEGIRRRFPDHSVIAEEAGSDIRESAYTWIVDPLDGTSNFAAGVPWYGVLIAILREGRPVIAVANLPAMGELFVAEEGHGAFRNGLRIAVSSRPALADVLWACGMDADMGTHGSSPGLHALSKLLSAVRNVRATNSLVDPMFTADGRFGGMINFSTKVWDIAAPSLIVGEAGGTYTRVNGDALQLDVSRDAHQLTYAVLAGAAQLHRQALALLQPVAGAADASAW